METLPAFDAPLLEAAMGRILAEPQNWCQSTYACGTTRCIAGHVTELAGGFLIMDPDVDLAWECYTPEGQYESIGTFAQRMVGLTDAEADDLFERNNCTRFVTDIDVLHRKVKALVESRSGE